MCAVPPACLLCASQDGGSHTTPARGDESPGLCLKESLSPQPLRSARLYSTARICWERTVRAIPGLLGLWVAGYPRVPGAGLGVGKRF